jgi:cytochrome c oxidase cbb3-type subunit 3
MSDMPTDFWSGWIAALTLTSLAGLAWFVISVYFSKDDSHAPGEGPSWDGNLREGSHPAPMWWFWLLFSMMIVSVIYLMLYPGLGSFSGVLKWSQGGRLEQSIEAFQEEFGGSRRLIAEGQLSTLQQDPMIMASARRVYDRNCAVCHGYEAQGQAQMFPDLRDGAWQWGGSAEQIEQTIRQGRNAAMVGWGPVLGDDGVKNVVAYLAVLGTDSGDGHAGQAQYNQFCVACHGVGGDGNPQLGAPSLVDAEWLYGNSEEVLIESVSKGRAGEMPAFGNRLDDTQIRMLVALLSSDEFLRERD